MSYPLNSRALNTVPLGGPSLHVIQSYTADVTVQYDDDGVSAGAGFIAPVAAAVTVRYDNDAVYADATFITSVSADAAVVYADDQVSVQAVIYPPGGYEADAAIQYADDVVSGMAHFIAPVIADVGILFEGDTVQAAGGVATIAHVDIQYADDGVSADVWFVPAVRADVAVTYDDDGVASNGRFDWTALLDPLVTQPYYACDVTVDGETLRLPMSSWQASLKVGTSYVQAVIPAIKDDVADWILSGTDVHFAVYKGARLADGGSNEELIAEAPLQTPSLSGGWLNKTLTMKGYTQFEATPGAVRTLTGVQMAMDERVRCNIDFFLRPGQQAQALGRTVTVGYINYYANDTQQYMDVGEAR